MPGDGVFVKLRSSIKANSPSQTDTTENHLDAYGQLLQSFLDQLLAETDIVLHMHVSAPTHSRAQSTDIWVVGAAA